LRRSRCGSRSKSRPRHNDRAGPSPEVGDFLREVRIALVIGDVRWLRSQPKRKRRISTHTVESASFGRGSAFENRLIARGWPQWARSSRTRTPSIGWEGNCGSERSKRRSRRQRGRRGNVLVAIVTGTRLKPTANLVEAAAVAQNDSWGRDQSEAFRCIGFRKAAFSR
jgi:hypothetical protein